MLSELLFFSPSSLSFSCSRRDVGADCRRCGFMGCVGWWWLGGMAMGGKRWMYIQGGA